MMKFFTFCQIIPSSLDGRYAYCQFPHILLFITAIAMFVFLWMPYTLLLVLMQWLWKISHLKLLRWIPSLKPVYDAPLKDKHHYWFGILLLVRGILFVVCINILGAPKHKLSLAVDHVCFASLLCQL